MREQPPADDWKVIYISDPSSMTNYDFDPGRSRPLTTSHPTTPEELREVVDNIATGRPSTLIQEVYNAGWTMFYRSERFEYDARPQHRRFIPMMDDGIMPLQVLLEQARSHGMQFLAGFRLNDNHGAPDQGGMFLHKNPQWKIKDMPPGTGFLPGNCMDFSYDGVRDYVFSVIEEVVERFDVDGIELVFREAIYFPAPDGDRSVARDSQPLMTDLIGRVRSMLDSREKTCGRRLLLGARVPETLEECANIGFDVPTWIGEKLIDYVAPMDMMYSDFNAQYDEFSSLTRDTDCHLYPGVQPFVSQQDRTGPPMTLENYRALARTYRRSGADGISLYNFQMHWDGFRSPKALGAETNYPLSLSYMRELGELAKIDAGGRHYLFHPMWGDSTNFGPPGMTPHSVFRDERVSLVRNEKGACGRFRFRLYEDPDKLAFAKLFFRAIGLGPYDHIEVDINGVSVPDDRVRHLWHQEGREEPMGRPLPSYTTCLLDLSAPPLISGDNHLGVKLLFSGLVQGVNEEPASIVIDEVEVTVLPR